MNKRILALCLLCLFVFSVLAGCSKKEKNVKIGVSFGVGSAIRWENEKRYMEEHAKELDVGIEVRLNKTDEPKTQTQDCIEMIDSGVDVLILTPRDVNNVAEILEYAKKKNVPVISYARVVLGQKLDLFVGYDSSRIGQRMGQYISEAATKGDYILLSGPETDNNATLLYSGAMRYLEPLKNDINIILAAQVPGWDPAEAKKLVLNAIKANGNKIDAILAPNDKIAGACAEAVKELGIENEVIITGMDAELDAAKRIVAKEQSSTIYMDLKQLAHTAVDEAVNFARKEKINANTEYDNQSGDYIKANLISGQLVTIDNLDRVLIESGCFTREEVYGE